MPPSSNASVVVVDIGSNSIKSLVAARGPDGTLVGIAERTEETRIGGGISGQPPRLSADAMARAIDSIRVLLGEAAAHSPQATHLVATSAVRDAANRADFVAALRRATGFELRVLDGAEEARLIGRGVASDPALRGLERFYLFDLGGGSLEMLAIAEEKPVQAVSLQLGCVRVTELCLPDPQRPLDAAAVARILSVVRKGLDASGFRFDLPAPRAAVVTGGSATTYRAIRAAGRGVALEKIGPVLAVAEMEELARRLAALDLAGRRAIPGMPAGRADVLPAALLTLVELARRAGVDALQHSMHNLRFGLAAELLGLR